MKTDFKKIIMNLMSRGFTEQSLVDMLDEWGVECTQPTINRIKNGLIKTPSYDLGVCLVKLYEQSRSAFIESLRVESLLSSVTQEKKNTQEKQNLKAKPWMHRTLLNSRARQQQKQQQKRR